MHHELSVPPDMFVISQSDGFISVMQSVFSVRYELDFYMLYLDTVVLS